MDLNEKTISELEDMMRHPEKLSEAVPEPEVPAEPVAETAPPEETPQNEVAAPAEAEAVAETVETPEDVQRQILEATIEELTARQKKMESVLGKHAGEADFWRRKAEATVRPESMPTEDSYADSEVPRTAPKPPMSDSTTLWIVGQAISQAVAGFTGSHPDFSEFQGEVSSYLQATGYKDEHILTLGDPLLAQRETTRILDEAYWHAKAERAAKSKVDFEKKRAEQFRGQTEAKKRAAISGSGSAPPPRPKAKTTADMTTAELETELRRLSR